MKTNQLSHKDFLSHAFRSILISAPSVFLASLYFAEFRELAAAALISIGSAHVLKEFLDKNREAIWRDKRSPYIANSVLAMQISAVFFGSFLSTIFLSAYSLIPALASQVNIASAYRNEFIPLFSHNLQLLLVAILFALWYRSGALMLLLSWQAVHWAFSFHQYMIEIGSSQGGVAVLLVILSIVPHLVLEVFAFVLAGMSGVFMSKAIVKYKLSSDEFVRVSRACLGILAISILSLLLSTLAELYIAQTVFQKFS